MAGPHRPVRQDERVAAPRTIDVPPPTHTAHALAWGPDDGRLVVALHGFPDSADNWRYLGPHLADRMPLGSRADLVEGAGHFLQVERPDVVNALVADWLS